MTRDEKIDRLVAEDLWTNANATSHGPSPGYDYVLRSGFVGYKNFSDQELSDALNNAGIDPETGERS